MHIAVRKANICIIIGKAFLVPLSWPCSSTSGMLLLNSPAQDGSKRSGLHQATNWVMFSGHYASNINLLKTVALWWEQGVLAIWTHDLWIRKRVCYTHYTTAPYYCVRVVIDNTFLQRIQRLTWWLILCFVVIMLDVQAMAPELYIMDAMSSGRYFVTTPLPTAYNSSPNNDYTSYGPTSRPRYYDMSPTMTSRNISIQTGRGLCQLRSVICNTLICEHWIILFLGWVN